MDTLTAPGAVVTLDPLTAYLAHLRPRSFRPNTISLSHRQHVDDTDACGDEPGRPTEVVGVVRLEMPA